MLAKSLLILLAQLGFTSPAIHSYSPSCRYLPGDKEWPSSHAWLQLNSTVGGRLVATVPLGSPCHDPSYNADECAALRKGWVYPQTHFESSSSIVAPFFQNQSCDPFTPRSSPCQLGTYPSYAIKVTQASDVAAGLAFAQNNNIRLIIKNTGHDLLGRSTGQGSLSLWTHYLKELSATTYQSPSYSGPAIKIGAGVQAWEAYEAAAKHNLRVVGGTCPTVGLAGGYTQGGGHSMLSTAYGLAADQVLEWDVVVADGSRITATPTAHANLYWALSGGGGGTYAVVLGMTVKAYPDGRVTGALIQLQRSGSDDAYWQGVTELHAAIPRLTDSGAALGYYLTADFMSVQPVTFPDKSAAEVRQLLAQLARQLDAIHASYNVTVTEYSNYLDFTNAFFGPLPYGSYASAQVQGGRLVPRAVLVDRAANQRLAAALRAITAARAFHVVGVGLDVRRGAARPNAVLPAWRAAGLTLVVAADWDYAQPFATNAANETLITSKWDLLLAGATGPDGGAYLNEGDFREPDWQRQFFGANYARLKQVKVKYDPHHVFYGTALVGSEDWTVQSDGRLCRA